MHNGVLMKWMRHIVDASPHSLTYFALHISRHIKAKETLLNTKQDKFVFIVRVMFPVIVFTYLCYSRRSRVLFCVTPTSLFDR